MEFTVSPKSGYQFDVSSIVVQWQRSGTGNTQISLRSSADSYATDLDGIKSVTDNTTTQTFTWTFTQANSSSDVTYRLYSYAEATGGTGGPGDGTGNDIIVNGTVSSTGGVSAPTTQASAINFTSVSQTGMTANWTNGNGSKRVVIMNTSNSFTAPTDGTDPTANAAYNGSGEQVIYNNSSNSVVVSGLSASTTYWYRVYEYNGSGATTKYFTDAATDNPNSQTTTAPPPIITLTPTTLTGFTYTEGAGSSSEQTFTVNGANLTNNISIAAATNYEISKSSGSGYTSPLVYTPAEAAATPTVYVRLKAGLSAANYNSETITATSTGAADKTITCSGTVTAIPIPGATIAIAATSVNSNSITANWDAVSGATGYRLDVYEKGIGGNADDLFISEYTEGAGTNKYIEIFNGTGASIDLSNYKLQLFFNGSATPGQNVTLSGTLADDAIIVYKNSLANFTLPVGVTAIDNAAANFSGNDAVALYKISTAAYVDIFGIIGSLPTGGAWTGADGYTTIVQTLVRKSSVSGGISTNPANSTDPTAFTTLTTEWNRFDPTPDNLGSHTFDGGSSNIFVPGFENLDVGNELTKVVTGLDPNKVYYYVVRAYNGSGTSANSNEITFFTAFTIQVNASAILPVCTTCNLAVANGGELTNDGSASRTYNSITVEGEGKLTNPSGSTLNLAALTLKSSATGTGTFINKGTLAVSGTSTVQQYLTNQSWYLTSPVNGTVTPTNLSRIQGYIEGDGDGNSWTVTGTTVTAGKGYITSVSAAPNTTEFSGTINSGVISIPLTRVSASNANKSGFNLIGNPYTAYLDWKLVYSANTTKMPTSTMWYRTKVSGSWDFSTVNGASGITSPANVSYLIPPMQAFWVRASTVGSSTLELTNDMVFHDNNSGNKLKAPTAEKDERQLIRLQVSNTTNSDELVIYTDGQALNSFDAYDSPKMSNGSANKPEISSIVDNEFLVINGLNNLILDTALPLRFMTKTANAFSFKASQVSNLPEGVKVLLNDYGTEFDLTSGEQYNFTSDIDDITNRFSIIFRSPSATTRLNKNLDDSILILSTNNGITLKINDVKLIDAEVSVFNVIGQKLLSKQLNSPLMHIEYPFTPDVYLVKVNNITKKVIVK